MPLARFDGTPAAGVRVRTWPFGGRQPYQNGWFATSDENGRVTDEHVHAGDVTIGLDRTAFARTFGATVLANQRTSSSIAIPRGIDVRGTVVSDHDDPV